MTVQNKPFWTIKAATETSSAELLLYGPISSTSWWDDEVTPKQFAKELSALGDIDELTVRINSGGGDVFAGQAIYSMIKSHKANVTVYVDGLAASIASVIAMAGNKVVMPKNAMMMVHNPWSYSRGNANDFREMADFLDKVRETLLATYEDKTGMSKEELIALLDAETWMTAEEAKEKGFIDEVDYTSSVAASMDGGDLLMNGVKFPAAKFRNMPQIAASVPVATQSKPREGVKPMNLEQLKNQYPDLYDQIRNEAITAERTRIQALEQIAVEGCEEIITKAKFETGATANDIALDIINAMKNSTTVAAAAAPLQTAVAQEPALLQAFQRDAQALNAVPQTPPTNAAEKEEQELNALVDMMAGAANTKRGV